MGLGLWVLGVVLGVFGFGVFAVSCFWVLFCGMGLVSDVELCV